MGQYRYGTAASCNRSINSCNGSGNGSNGCGNGSIGCGNGSIGCGNVVNGISSRVRENTKQEMFRREPIGMCYVPMQRWQGVMSPCESLMAGTAFEELNLIFCGERR